MSIMILKDDRHWTFMCHGQLVEMDVLPLDEYCTATVGSEVVQMMTYVYVPNFNMVFKWNDRVQKSHWTRYNTVLRRLVCSCVTSEWLEHRTL